MSTVKTMPFSTHIDNWIDHWCAACGFRSLMVGFSDRIPSCRAGIVRANQIANGATAIRKPSKKRTAKAPSKPSPILHSEAKRESATVSTMLARKLQEAIIAGEFEVGSPLGSERFLMAKYDCGRATVREALRVLRGQDLIEVRRGRNGGWFVSNPSQDRVVNSLDRLISGQDFRLNDLIFAREAIETASAVQAAQFPDEEKLAELRQANENCENAINDMDAFVDANLEWHLALARASNNPLFVTFLTSISRAMHIATEHEEFDVSIRRMVVGIHWQIYAAIRAGDAEAARRRTQRHLDAYRQTLAAALEEGGAEAA